MIWVLSYSVQNNQYKKLLAPIDADLRYCGVDDEVVDYPYIYYAAQFKFDPTAVPPVQIGITPVCAKECPATKDDPVDCYGATGVTA
jgi:hypothetical protein